MGSKKSKEEIHVFLDQCNHPMSRGNSGSLITLARDFSKKIGVYHWGVEPSAKQVNYYSYFEYLGNSGRTEYLTQFEVGSVFYDVGFALEHLNRDEPHKIFNSQAPF